MREVDLNIHTLKGENMKKLQDWIFKGSICAMGVLAPVMAYAEDPVAPGFTVSAPDFDFSVMGSIAAIMLAIAASVTVYRKVKGITARG